MEYNKSISSHGQDGQKPVNNPKPCFHIAIPRSGRPYTIESREDKTSSVELIKTIHKLFETPGDFVLCKVRRKSHHNWLIGLNSRRSYFSLHSLIGQSWNTGSKLILREARSGETCVIASVLNYENCTIYHVNVNMILLINGEG